MVYTLEEISRLVQPVAEKYQLKAVYIFGSYARCEAQDDSDIDLLVDLTGADLSEFFCGGRPLQRPGGCTAEAHQLHDDRLVEPDMSQKERPSSA